MKEFTVSAVERILGTDKPGGGVEFSHQLKADSKINDWVPCPFCGDRMGQKGKMNKQEEPSAFTSICSKFGKYEHLSDAERDEIAEQ